MFHVPGTYSGGASAESAKVQYSWTQSKSEIELKVPIPADAASSVKCSFEARKLQLSFASDTIAGELPAVVVVMSTAEFLLFADADGPASARRELQTACRNE